jgi:hypothetical protein
MGQSQALLWVSSYTRTRMRPGLFFTCYFGTILCGAGKFRTVRYCIPVNGVDKVTATSR